jgi:hypothetical protein
MHSDRTLFGHIIIILAIFSLACGKAISFDQAVVTINSGVSHQTITGWEAVAQVGQSDFINEFGTWRDKAIDQAAELGINRLRVPLRSGSENPVDHFQRLLDGQITREQFRGLRYEIVNDNGDPNSINPGGFHFTEMDFYIDNVVTPLRRRLQEAGEPLVININYTDFEESRFEHKSAPAEYGEFVLATYRHLQTKYGWAPDYWEVILEPDNSTWTARHLADCIVAAGDRLAAAGFTPAFIAPSTAIMSTASTYFDVIKATPGAMRHLKEISYHRYGGVSDANLQAIANRARANNINTSMLERIGADHVTLHEDLSEGLNSAWQQFALAFPTVDNGAQYFVVDRNDPSNPQVRIGSRTKFLRQYFKFVRHGALRLGATSNNEAIDPLCFRNKDGKYVVVIKAGGGGAISIRGLPAGIYGIKYTTNSQYDIDAADATITSGQSLETNIPAAGVITIYGKQGQAAPGGQAFIDRCRLNRTPTGAFTLTVFGRNIKAGATVTVGGAVPKKVKFKEETSPGEGIFRRLVLKKKICKLLPGAIVITNPGAPGSEAFDCDATCSN